MISLLILNLPRFYLCLCVPVYLVYLFTLY